MRRPNYNELEKEVLGLRMQVEELRQSVSSDLKKGTNHQNKAVLNIAGEVGDENYKTILNKMGDPVFVKDAQSRLLLVNDAFCEMFGLTRDDIIGKTLAEHVPPDEREHFLKVDKQVIADGNESIIEELLTIGDNETRTISTRKTRFTDQSGDKFLVGIIRDLTDQKRAQGLVNAMLNGQEQERKRLGSELHDGIGQILSAISLDISQIRANAKPRGNCNVSDELQNLNEKVQSAITEVRNISHNLMPQVLDSFGLSEAIKHLCSGFHEKSGIVVEYNHVDVDTRYDPDLEVNLYRIAQELLNNIHKHAKCKNVFVNLLDHGPMLSLTIEDDGVGFNPKKNFEGIGIRNIYSRVAAIDGEINLESADNSGTLVSVEIPKAQS